jgi:putative SOS response-associated peptidase YedK
LHDALGHALVPICANAGRKKRAAKIEAKGKPVDLRELLRMEPDSGTTNIRNTSSKHWTRWLGVENRCVVPFTSFSEFNKIEGGDIWFALNESRPLAGAGQKACAAFILSGQATAISSGNLSTTSYPPGYNVISERLHFSK